MTAHTPSAHEIETFTGRYVDTHQPDPATICIEDIAHHLANTCRYGGACSRFYSVAEHAVMCSLRVQYTTPHALWLPLAALHHDDSEAYLGDIPRPLKPLLGNAYKILTINMDTAIINALRPTWHGEHGPVSISVNDLHAGPVKAADTWALFVEAYHLLPSKGINWSGSFDAWDMDDAAEQQRQAVDVPGYWLGGVAPAIAEDLFLARHRELTKEV